MDDRRFSSSEDAGSTPAGFAIHAHNSMHGKILTHTISLLARIGFEVNYVSANGTSTYLRWPGFEGVLRVSDHQGQGRHGPPIWARITFSRSLSAREMTDEKVSTRVAQGVGRYFLASARSST